MKAFFGDYVDELHDVNDIPRRGLENMHELADLSIHSSTLSIKAATTYSLVLQNSLINDYNCFTERQEAAQGAGHLIIYSITFQNPRHVT